MSSVTSPNNPVGGRAQVGGLVSFHTGPGSDYPSSRVQLNVENIFNKGYWASANGDNHISPGQPRTFRLMAIAKL